jgi:Protein of unknown function (DUF3108)
MPRLPRCAGAVLLALAVLLGHLHLLGSLWPEAPPAQALLPAPATTVRLLAPPPRPASVQPPTLPPAVPSAAAAARSKAPAQPAATTPTAALAQDTPSAPADLLPADDTPVPVYATRLPEPALLHYRLQRGDAVGSGSLHWQPVDGGYALQLDTDWPGRTATGLASRGLIDADGMAPLRHADLRRAREQRAVNFQREAGRITFSGPQASYALRPGAQDRLSWMIQLPAIIEADAALAREGAGITLFVAGTRGDAEAWRFEVQGREALSLPAGDVPQALWLRREPTRPYDTRVEVWLDPQRQHLPVRARFTTLPGGSALELLLAKAPAAPP